MIKPINVESLKEKFVKQFEEHILSGYFSIGEKLPSERELAVQMGVSRPVVHEGLVDLAAKGLVTMKPRHGTIVNDYRKEGSLALLHSLMLYKNCGVEDDLLKSLLDMRMLFEVENARLAALNRNEEQLEELFKIVEAEKAVKHRDLKKITDLDFNFHHTIAMATGNVIYPLMLNSMKQFYTNITAAFFKERAVIPVVFEFHASIADAVKDRDEKKTVSVMKEMLLHGEINLQKQRL